MVESIHGMEWDSFDLLPIPDALLRDRRLDVERAIWFLKSQEPDALLPTFENLESKLAVASMGMPEFDVWLWACLPCLDDPTTEVAASFLYESHQRAWFANKQRWKMARHSEHERPSLPTEVARLEAAVVSAYKAVEALIGFSSPEHVSRRLTLNHFSTNAKMWFSPYRTLGEELTLLATARDARAAHGSLAAPRSTPVSYYEVMGWQVCAQLLLSDLLHRKNPFTADMLSLLRMRGTASLSAD